MSTNKKWYQLRGAERKAAKAEYERSLKRRWYRCEVEYDTGLERMAKGHKRAWRGPSGIIYIYRTTSVVSERIAHRRALSGRIQTKPGTAPLLARVHFLRGFYDPTT